jgi:tripartite-type tricarboxylate transporter receptor subunit TctC
MMKLRCCATLAMLGAAAVAHGAAAPDFPTRPIRIVVGPGPDIVGRIIGQKLIEAWGQQIVVDTRPGGGGVIAAEIVAKSSPDGYTLLLSSASYSINAVLQPGTTDILRDFTSVAFCASAPFLLLVHPSVPAKSLKELVALAKAKPGTINYASSGNGTPPHMAGEMFKSMAGINLVHVPYKNAAPALVDVVGGQVQMIFAIASIALGHYHSGKARALAVTSAQRTNLAPDLPTIAESGYPGYEVIGWNGLVAPAGTPKAIVDKINAEAMRALKQQEVVQRFFNAGYDAAKPNTPEQFAEQTRREVEMWRRLVKESGAKVD